MAIIYFLAMALPYIAAFVLTITVAAGAGLLIWLLNGRHWWAWLAGLALAVAASTVSPLLQRLESARITARLAAAEPQAATLALEPGALIHLHDGNHYGITCRPCDFAALPFVTEAETASIHPLLIDESGVLLERTNLNAPTPDRATRGRFRYAFLSVPQVWYEGAPFDPPAWYPSPVPEDLKGVHMLVALPPTGIIRPAELKPLYLRVNRQYEAQMLFSWGFVTQTVARPEPEEIFADLAARATGQ
ncbi:hypothetical protein [Vannielia litorea]|uniref:Uncharacterized protein n=1 Tax=Vannielia litorea TaxID=1217970 RepID=A0A1N6FD70_9RHOB|nr:hypothetical protein [Vannielia litorea]SIN93197.1 hypothetical protein SAMN05444002_1578 [Vannielia litorea]